MGGAGVGVGGAGIGVGGASVGVGGAGVGKVYSPIKGDFITTILFLPPFPLPPSPCSPPSLPPLTHELLNVLMLRPLQEQQREGAEHGVVPKTAHGSPEDGGEEVSSQRVPLQQGQDLLGTLGRKGRRSAKPIPPS